MTYLCTCSFTNNIPSLQLNLSAPSAKFAKRLARSICVSEGMPEPKMVRIK